MSDLRYAPSLNDPELLDEDGTGDPEGVDDAEDDRSDEVEEPASSKSPYAIEEVEMGFDPNRTIEEGIDPALEFARLLLIVRGNEN